MISKGIFNVQCTVIVKIIVEDTMIAAILYMITLLCEWNVKSF